MSDGPINAEPSVETASATSLCWRCELPLSDQATECPHCLAPPKSRDAFAAPATSTHLEEVSSLKTLLVSYALLLLTGIVHAVMIDARFSDVSELTDEVRTQAWTQVIVVEAIDTLIVLATLAALARRKLPRQNIPRGPSWTWLASVAGVFAMLWINQAYHAILLELVDAPPLEQELAEQASWLAFVAVCVQPAVVEEVYCRGLLIGALRRFVGSHACVWITAVMFGMMHVSVFLSIPYLILFGAFLGYARVATGTMWIPVLLHFLHNLMVQLQEWT
jgi:uncharacterized protein